MGTVTGQLWLGLPLVLSFESLQKLGLAMGFWNSRSTQSTGRRDFVGPGGRGQAGTWRYEWGHRPRAGIMEPSGLIPFSTRSSRMANVRPQDRAPGKETVGLLNWQSHVMDSE